MNERLAVLYRGPLASCNYACGYCPFAKRPPDRATLARDRDALGRFVGWVGDAAGWRLELSFTPWGEALVWPWYRDALVQLSRSAHVRQVSIQTARASVSGTGTPIKCSALPSSAKASSSCPARKS